MTLPDGDKTFEISIAKPHTVGTMFNKHTEYAISVKTTMENYPVDNLKVNRRYSDFEWLFNRLTRTFPGRVIPPIPEKQSRNRFDKDFVEGRRRSDLVRFGRFSGSSYIWPFKGGQANGTGVQSFYDIYPIPSNELANNTNMSQNPGY